jgi:hypothetical protein
LSAQICRCRYEVPQGYVCNCELPNQRTKKTKSRTPSSTLKRLQPIPGGLKTNPRGPMSVAPRNPGPSAIPRRR